MAAREKIIQTKCGHQFTLKEITCTFVQLDKFVYLGHIWVLPQVYDKIVEAIKNPKKKTKKKVEEFNVIRPPHWRSPMRWDKVRKCQKENWVEEWHKELMKKHGQK